MSGRKSGRKMAKKLPNDIFAFHVEEVINGDFLTPDKQSINISPTKPSSDLQQRNQNVPNRKVLRSLVLNALENDAETECSYKAKQSTEVTNKKKDKRPSSKVSNNNDSNNMKAYAESSDGKDNVGSLATRTRARKKFSVEEVQSSTISTLVRSPEVNDSCSFVTLRKHQHSKHKDELDLSDITLNDKDQAPDKSSVQIKNVSSVEVDQEATNLTYTPPNPAAKQGMNTSANQVRDLFELVSRTPRQELDKLMLNDGESVLLSESVYKNMSAVPRLTRTSTFTVTEPVNTSTVPSARKSGRKRWSQSAKTPIFETNPPTSILKKTNHNQVKLNTTENNLLEDSMTVNKTLRADKSVSFFVPSPKVSIAKSKTLLTNQPMNITNFNDDFLPQSSSRKSSEDSVVFVSSTTLDRSGLRGAPSAKNSTTKQTSTVAGNNLQDSVIRPDSTSSDSSEILNELSGASKSIMKSMRGKKQAKEKKSVKLESPKMTPKGKKLQPLAIRKTPLLKTVFNGDNSIIAGNCVVPSGPSASSTPFRSETDHVQNLKSKLSSKGKMPDFRKIHDRQYEKMESIKEHQDRKAARAQLLISGSKPNLSKVSKPSEKDSKRKLVFSPNVQMNLPKPEQERVMKRASLEKQLIDRKQKSMKSKLPKMVMSKPQQHLVEKNKRNSLEKKPSSALNKYGFKIAPGKTNNLTKEVLVKSVTTKSKVGPNLSERNRTQVANVRTNRRFELLMKMRADGKK